MRSSFRYWRALALPQLLLTLELSASRVLAAPADDDAVPTVSSAADDAGDRDAGDRNAGDRDAGDRNAGDRNAGDRNAGDRDAGDRDVSAAEQDSLEHAYHQAFLALARGERRAASRSLRQLLERAPEHRLAPRSRDVLRALDLRALPAEPASRRPAHAGRQPPGETRTGAARAELIFSQTLHGVAVGAETCLLLECSGLRLLSLASMLGGGAGLTASWLASRDGVRPGLSRALTDGTLFGFANGAWLTLVTKTTDRTGALLLGQLMGLGAGGLLYDQFEPTVGQVSLASSGGVWLSASTLLLIAALDADVSEQTVGTSLLLATNLGLLGGALLASETRPSPGRALLIDAGGVLGMLTGMGTSVLLQDDVREQPTFAAGLAGTLSGLALAYYLTADWDAEPAPGESSAAVMRFGLSPLPGGASATLGGAF